MHAKNILFSLLTALVCIPNIYAMHCAIKPLHLNYMQQQVRRHLTGFEVGGLYLMGLIACSALGKICVCDSSTQGLLSMQDFYRQAAMIGTSCCSEAYKTNNPSDCQLIACCFQQNSKRVSDTVKTEKLLEWVDAQEGGRLGFLLMAEKCIDDLHEIEIKALKAFSASEKKDNWNDFKHVLGIIAHKTQCIRNEVCIIKRNTPNYVEQKYILVENRYLSQSSTIKNLTAGQDSNKE